MRLLVRLLARIGAALLALAIVVVPVVVIAKVAGNPLSPDVLDGLGERNVDDATIVRLGSLAFYAAWAWTVAPAMRQVRLSLAGPAPSRRLRPDRHRPVRSAPTAGRGPRAMLARLVRYALAAGLAMPAVVPILSGIGSTTTTTAVVATPIAASLVLDADDAGAGGPATTDRARAAPREQVAETMARHRDTPYAIAMRLAPDRADEVREQIVALNVGRPMPDGAMYRGGAFPVGMTVLTPNPPAAAASPATPDAAAADSAPYLAEHTVTVEVGDNLWDLSSAALAAAGEPDEPGRTLDYLDDVVAANPAVADDPDLIFPGERIVLPTIGTAPRNSPRTGQRPGDGRTEVTPSRRPTDRPLPPPTSPPVDTTAVPPIRPSPAQPDAGTPPVPTSTTSTTSTTSPVGADPTAAPERGRASSPSPIGVGEAAVLSAGVLALLAARRRARLRAARPQARVPQPTQEMVATERRLRFVDAAERVLRVDIAVRAAAATLVEGSAQIAVVRAGTDGSIELTLTAGASLPAPWLGDGSRWTLSGSIPVELLADAARSVGAPCVALTQLGADDEGGDVLVDLEALGLLAIGGPPEDADAVVRGVAATLASSVFAELANLIGVGVDPAAFLGHRHAHHVDTVDEAVELATALVGTTAATVQSTFVLRARHTSGEAWEPAVVLTGATAAIDATDELARTAARRRGGFALVVAGPVDGAPWSLRCGRSAWTLEPLGLEIVPVGLSVAEVVALDDLVRHAGAPLEPVVDGDPVDVLIWSDDVVDRGQDPSHDGDGHDEPVSGGRASAEDAAYRDPDWSLMVRLLGPVGVVDRRGAAVPFGRSKTLELVTWLALHREHSTRQGARTALWELDVRDATFANVVSEARRSMARHVAPPEGAEWLGRTLTEVLPLHDAVVTDADLVRARVDHARTLPPDLAIDTLRPAVELIVDAPFAGTGYLWPDPEGLTSNLVLLATGAATDLAGHCLSMGDVDGVFWATGQGLKVLPGHEELIGLRMRAHARAGDLSGVRLEWRSYERVLDADRWGDGEPAEKLVTLRKQLLST